MSMSRQPNSLLKVCPAPLAPREAPAHAAPPPVYPRSGYARKHPRPQDAPIRRLSGNDDEPQDFGNAV